MKEFKKEETRIWELTRQQNQPCDEDAVHGGHDNDDEGSETGNWPRASCGKQFS